MRIRETCAIEGGGRVSVCRTGKLTPFKEFSRDKYFVVLWVERSGLAPSGGSFLSLTSVRVTRTAGKLL